MSSHGIIHLTRDADWSQIHEPNPDNPVEAPFMPRTIADELLPSTCLA